MRRWLWPGLFALLVALLAVGLTRDPTQVDSPLVGQPVPAFEGMLLASPDREFDPAWLRDGWNLVNVWASWCVTCLEEHALLLSLSDLLPVYGINHRDLHADALRWLQRHGNPYRAVVFDGNGEVGIEFGVYKVPETFLVDPAGIIRYRHAGALTAATVEREILSRIQGGRS